jgi:hypothetical protein
MENFSIKLNQNLLTDSSSERITNITGKNKVTLGLDLDSIPEGCPQCVLRGQGQKSQFIMKNRYDISKNIHYQHDVYVQWYSAY